MKRGIKKEKKKTDGDPSYLSTNLISRRLARNGQGYHKAERKPTENPTGIPTRQLAPSKTGAKLLHSDSTPHGGAYGESRRSDHPGEGIHIPSWSVEALGGSKRGRPPRKIDSRPCRHSTGRTSRQYGSRDG